MEKSNGGFTWTSWQTNTPPSFPAAICWRH